MYIKYQAGKNMGHSKKNHKEDKEFANEQMNMTGVSNWEVLRCREFTTEAFVEMVLRHFFV